MDIYAHPERWTLSGEVIVAIALCFILCVLAVVIGILAKKADPLKKPKGLLLLAEWAVEKLDSFTADIMGVGFENFGGILMGIIPFLFLSFTIGVTGLPTPMNNLAVPLSLGLVTFLLIHYTSIRFTKWKYFQRYVDPFPFFLPVNLLSMWAPLLSMTFRLFGNAVVGWILLGIINGGLETLSGLIFSFIPSGVNQVFLVPIVTPVLHAYFDMFSGFIQTTVFVFLTVLFVAQERPDDIEAEVNMASRKEVAR